MDPQLEFRHTIQNAIQNAVLVVRIRTARISSFNEMQILRVSASNDTGFEANEKHVKSSQRRRAPAQMGELLVSDGYVVASNLSHHRRHGQ